MQIAGAFIVGVLFGGTIVLAVWWWSRRREADLAQRLLDAAQERKAAELSGLLEQVRTQFAALSREALSANTDDFLKLAKSRLDQQATAGGEVLETKKKLIDAQLEAMGKRLGELAQTMQTQESQRRESHGVIRSQLEQAAKVTQQLQTTTDQLRQALANPQRRGQWGERIAEDVLRLAGFIEGVNYDKQSQLADGTRPDFTFPMPNAQHVNMDVKFPIDNYLRVLESEDEAARASFATAFIRDVRTRIREVTTRDYIDPAAGTVDYVLVFIPNEQIYAFVHEQEPGLLDEALRSKVVLCSPLTLYAVLAIMRQVAQNFRLQQASYEILDLLAAFRKQWDKYGDVVDRLGKRLEDALKAYSDLTTTRSRQLERQLDKIDALREARQLEAPAEPAELSEME